MTNAQTDQGTIEFVEVSKSFPGRGEVIHSLSARLPKGVIGLLGPNGAGKTTLMRLLCGIYRPSSGKIFYNGERIDRGDSLKKFKMELGYLPQNIGFSKDLTVYEFLEYMCHLKGHHALGRDKEYLESLLAEVSLLDSRNRRAGTLSGGMTRRLGIAQALIGDPSVLVVDEPTAGLDPEERMRFRRILSRFAGSRTVILSTHILDDVASTCEYVLFMRSGTVLDIGPLSQVISTAAGHVWITPPMSSPESLTEDYGIVAEERGLLGTRYRVVGQLPSTDFEPVDPTLDDAYLLRMIGENK